MGGGRPVPYLGIPNKTGETGLARAIITLQSEAVVWHFRITTSTWWVACPRHVALKGFYWVQAQLFERR